MKFRQYLTKLDTVLDISIQCANRYLTSNKRITELLDSYVEVEHKTDGIKLNVVKVHDNGNIDDYIFSYKGNILYNTEYDYQPMTRAKSEAIGSSQFKICIDHFSKLGKTDIPVNTEFFIEYLMRKPTLSSNYSTHHKMVLIGTSEVQYSTKFGKLKTFNTGLDISNRDTIAKELKIDTPQVLFTGFLGSLRQFEAGIVNPELRDLFNARRNSMNFDNPELLIKDIRELFLEVPSKYGGKEEGVILKIRDSASTRTKLLKFQQDYQNDQESRRLVRAQFQCTSREDENNYWDSVKATALLLSTKVGTGTESELPDLLANLSTELKYLPIDICHEKKSTYQIKDDIQLTAKTQIIKNLRGNNNCLIVGKFRVLTTGHYQMINRAMKFFDNVVICVISNSETRSTTELRTSALRSVYPDVDIIHHSTGNLISIINKSPKNINAVFAGTDRVSDYVRQLQRSNGIGVREMPRTPDDISASKVIENINDHEYFKNNTPEELHDMYPEYKRIYTLD